MTPREVFVAAVRGLAAWLHKDAGMMDNLSDAIRAFGDTKCQQEYGVDTKAAANHLTDSDHTACIRDLLRECGMEGDDGR